MGQLSLYRRYRPQTFAEVVGQSHVTRTLQNALTEGRLPHACLFSGPRGTGKTSTARILAKALNCEQAPAREPCNACAACREVTEGSSLDVIEIDAASHGSVDDARDLREKVAYSSVGGRRKVYIIDECHMLTAAANNALLKVLEEPPDHVVFVFATTEPSKVLQTVQDRCQRYEFRSVGAEAVAARIRQVCEAEGVTIDGAAAALIAARTTGSVRDALGLLDQAVSYSGSTITTEDIARLFGTVPGEILFEAIDIISERDAGACFAFTDRLIRSGQDPREFLRALVDHLRQVFLVQHAGAAQEILDVADEQLDRLRGQANRFSPADLLRILDLAGEAHIQLRQAVDSRLALEIAFARMARPELHASPASLLARIERLERASGVEAAEAPSPAPAVEARRVLPRPPATQPVRRAAPPPRAEPPAPAARAEPVSEALEDFTEDLWADPWEAATPVPPVVATAAPPSPPASPAPATLAATAAPATTAPATLAATAAPASPPASPAPATPPATTATVAPHATTAPVAPPAAATPPVIPTVASTAQTGPPTVDLDHIARAWPSVLELVKKRKISAQAMLLDAVPVAYAHGELTLEFSPTHRFHRDKVSDPKAGYLLPLVESLHDTFGIRPAIRCVLGQNEHRRAGAAEAATPAPAGAPPATRTQESATRPKDAIDLIREGFAAEIVEETHG